MAAVAKIADCGTTFYTWVLGTALLFVALLCTYAPLCIRCVELPQLLEAYSERLVGLVDYHLMVTALNEDIKRAERGL